MTEIIRQKTNGPAAWGLNEERLFHTVFLDNDRISVVESEKKTGKNRASGKQYTRFANQHRYVFSWRNGPLRVYTITEARRHKPRMMRDVTSAVYWSSLADHALPYLAERAPFDIDDVQLPAVRGTIREMERTRRIAQNIAYPALRGTKLTALPYLAPHLRERDLTAFTRSAFKSNYRKDLVRWIARQDTLDPVYAAWRLQKIMPLEWVMEGLDGARVTPFTTDGSVNKAHDHVVMEFFARIPERQRRNLMLDTRNDPQLMVDSMNALRNNYYAARIPEDYRYTTWSALHDVMFPPRANRNQMNTWAYTPYVPKNEKIPQGKIAKSVDGLTVDDLVIRSAKETDELRAWGGYMHNCIGSYGTYAVEKSTFLFGVYRGEELIANMEVSKSKGVKQLFGKYNQTLDLELGQRICNAVTTQLGSEKIEYKQGWIDNWY